MSILMLAKYSPPFLSGHFSFTLTASAVNNLPFTIVLDQYWTVALLDVTMKQQFALRTQNTYGTTINCTTFIKEWVVR
ncbi:hypothetical protein T4A_9024 [Trichinella pseudospiralis]|uniref:Uncharacterized protein n=1 Tax=Trichinella pseudospiralis TaxID=6337 RepID=A0A0V1DSN9_TRIPS|nr:hypothetical protein T4A_9024 [Trichinella pseudospiralis]